MSFYRAMNRIKDIMNNCQYSKNGALITEIFDKNFNTENKKRIILQGVWHTLQHVAVSAY